MKYNFKTQSIKTIINDLPANGAWWKGTPSEKYIIPVEDIFQTFERHALMVSPETVSWEYVTNELAKVAGVSEDKIEGYNTYNDGNNALSRELQYYSIEQDGRYFVAFAIHRGGDVRCNYTDYVMFVFEHWEDCWGSVEEMASEDFSTNLVVDGKTYTITPRPRCEWYDVYCIDDQFQTELWPDDITDEEMAKAIKKARQE